jgi:hypothetical protein
MLLMGSKKLYQLSYIEGECTIAFPCPCDSGLFVVIYSLQWIYSFVPKTKIKCECVKIPCGQAKYLKPKNCLKMKLIKLYKMSNF